MNKDEYIENIVIVVTLILFSNIVTSICFYYKGLDDGRKEVQKDAVRNKLGKFELENPDKPTFYWKVQW